MPIDYEPMGPADFVSALEEADLSASEFALLTGQPVARIRNMMFGAERIPHLVSVAATLMTLDRGVELARLHAQCCISEADYAAHARALND